MGQWNAKLGGSKVKSGDHKTNGPVLMACLECEKLCSILTIYLIDFSKSIVASKISYICILKGKDIVHLTYDILKDFKK